MHDGPDLIFIFGLPDLTGIDILARTTGRRKWATSLVDRPWSRYKVSNIRREDDGAGFRVLP